MLLSDPMKIDKAAEHRASQGLLAHVRANYPNIPAFCEATGLDRLKVQKAIRGKFLQMDAKFAFAVESATKGAVPASWWAEAPSEEPSSSAASDKGAA